MYLSDTPDLECHTYEANNKYDKWNINVTLTPCFADIAKRTSSLGAIYLKNQHGPTPFQHQGLEPN